MTQEPQIPEMFQKLNHVAKMSFSWVTDEKFPIATSPEVAALIAPPKPRRIKDRFPNTGCRNRSAEYGMFRTSGGHALAVKRCLRALRPIAATFDAIYVTGLSGIVPASVVAFIMQKELLVLRKTDSTGDTLSHGLRLEGDVDRVDGSRYIILDDFVSNGGTMRNLLASFPPNGKLVGVMLYGHPRSQNEIDMGMAKDFYSYGPDGQPNLHWNLVRRGPNNMVFDLVPIP